MQINMVTIYPLGNAVALEMENFTRHDRDKMRPEGTYRLDLCL